MGSIKIQDSGYILTDNSGTQASSVNRANSGSAITLKTMEFVPNFARELSNETELSANTMSEVNLGSINNLNFKIMCSITKTDTTEMNKIPELYNLIKTNGYKLLWYDYTDASAEGNTESLLYQTARNSLFGDQLTAGEISAFSISAQFYTLHVLFKSIQFKDSPKGTIKFDLVGVVVPVLTSGI